MNVSKTTRRTFVLSGTMGSLALLVTACGAPPVSPTAAPAAAKPTAAPAAEATKPAAAATAAPAPAATTAPPAAATKPAAAATAAPVAAATTAPAPAASKPGSGPVVSVRFNSILEDPQDTFWGPTLKKFEDEHPNIKVVKEWFPEADLHTKQLALAATGQAGDVVRVYIAPFITEMRLKGMLQPLDQYIKGDKLWSENDHPQFWPGNLATYTSGGQLWGYPVVGHPGGVQYYYNIDYFKSKNLPLPPVDTEKMTFDYTKWKHDDLLAMLKDSNTVAADGRVSAYGLLPGTSGEGAVAMLRSFGGDYYNAEGTKTLINTDASIAGLSFLSDYYNKYKIAVPRQTNPNYTELFPTQRVGMIVQSAIAGTVTRLVGDKFKWSVAPAPIGPVGKPVTQVSSNGVAMSKTSKVGPEAFEVIKMTTTREFGLKRFLVGLGSPGSRYDVWTDPEFKKFVPLMSTVIYDTLIDPKKAPPMMPWHHAANGRHVETDAAFVNIIGDVFLGKKTPKEAAEEAAKVVQAIMDKPAA